MIHIYIEREREGWISCSSLHHYYYYQYCCSSIIRFILYHSIILFEYHMLTSLMPGAWLCALRLINDVIITITSMSLYCMYTLLLCLW